MTNPTPTPHSTDPVVSFLHRVAAKAAGDCQFEMAVKIRACADAIAQRDASPPADADQAKGPSVDDVVELCQEFGFHLDSDDGLSLSILRDMITAAITRWRAPVAQPTAQPVNLAAPAPQGPEVERILMLAEIIREVDGRNDLGAAALAEAILAHPGFSGCHDGPAAWNQRNTWQPIETAPRDGTEIFAWDGKGVKVAWCYEGRWIYDDEMESPYLTHWHPTHWQPLPNPPPITPP